MPVTFRVDQNILNQVNIFKNCMRVEIDKMLSDISNISNSNFFSTPHYLLFCNIWDNVSMDLCYLQSLFDVQFDIFTFSGVYRNIRNSIETYYDLYNLHTDSEYLLLLQYKNGKTTIKPNFVSYNHDIYNEKCSNNRYLTITEKAEIALKNGFNSNLMENYQRFCKEANLRVHPNPFIPIYNLEQKSNILKDLLIKDCEILFNSFSLFVNYYNNFFHNLGFFYNNIVVAQNHFQKVMNIILQYSVLIGSPNIY